MILKIRMGKWRLTVTFAPVIDVVGVNSLLPDGKHILMWDFDDTPLDGVVLSLQLTQLRYELPNIYILETWPEKNYIAYCFKRCEWQQAVEVIASTRGICWNFFKWGVFRKRFTLRVSPKCGRIPKLVTILPSTVKEDADVSQLRSWVRYETLPDNWQPNIIKVGEH